MFTSVLYRTGCWCIYWISRIVTSFTKIGLVFRYGFLSVHIGMLVCVCRTETGIRKHLGPLGDNAFKMLHNCVEWTNDSRLIPSSFRDICDALIEWELYLLRLFCWCYSQTCHKRLAFNPVYHLNQSCLVKMTIKPSSKTSLESRSGLK